MSKASQACIGIFLQWKTISRNFRNEEYVSETQANYYQLWLEVFWNVISLTFISMEVENSITVKVSYFKQILKVKDDLNAKLGFETFKLKFSKYYNLVNFGKLLKFISVKYISQGLIRHWLGC